MQVTSTSGIKNCKQAYMFCLQILRNPVGIDYNVYSSMYNYNSLCFPNKFTR